MICSACWSRLKRGCDLHNLYEGVVKLELKLFLAYCIGKKYFTIDEVNRRICYYDFKSNEYKIRQSASQVIHYYSFLLLLKISAITLSPSVSLNTLPYLHILIEEKIELFNHFYPTFSVIPIKQSSQRGNFKNVPKTVAKITSSASSSVTSVGSSSSFSFKIKKQNS